MPSVETKRTITVALSRDEYEGLQRIADRTSCLAITGKTAGQPSIRRLIVEIGRGKLVVTSRASHGRRPAGAPGVPPSQIKKVEAADTRSTPPLWWPRDPDGFLYHECIIEGLPGEMASQARALGCREDGQVFWAPDHWIDNDPFPEDAVLPVPVAAAEPSFPQAWVDDILRRWPDWWPERGCSRGELVELLGIHEGEGPADTDRWIAEQGEWTMDGDRYVAAVAWKGAGDQ